MRIAFDLHGTLDIDLRLVEFVKSLSRCSEFQIFIISGPPRKQIEKELTQLGMNSNDQTYIEIISVVDYLKSKDVFMWQDENGWWCDPAIWWESKGLICSEYSIAIIFDDKYEYAKNMPNSTRFILWKGVKNEQSN